MNVREIQAKTFLWPRPPARASSHSVSALRAASSARSQQGIVGVGGVGLDEEHVCAKASRNGGGDPDSQFQQLPAPGQVDRVHWHTAWLPWHSLPDIRGQEPDFLSRITRMVEFHECFLKFEAKIRVICPFVTFVIQRCRVMNLEQEVSLKVDSFPGETFTGQVVYISDQAEFTPRNVQTVEGRRATVYAIELRVPNPEGKLKPGMPADVTFNIK